MSKRTENILAHLWKTIAIGVIWLSLSCSSTTKSQSDTEQPPAPTAETTEMSSDTTTVNVDVSETERDTGSGLVDYSNIEPLEPTEDCVHPAVTSNCEGSWCRIPKGCFIFGSVDSEGNHCRSKYGEDQAQVTLTHDFEISQTETTQTQWQSAGFELPFPISETPCPDCPISWITIYEAMAYCNALSDQNGLDQCYDLSHCTGILASGCPEGPLTTWGCDSEEKYVCTGAVHLFDDPYVCSGYRLPTTAEWEYAARAGTRTTTYIGDFEADIPSECISHQSADSIAWHCGNTDSDGDAPKYLAVSQKEANGFGLYDMLGNVAEYCASTRYNSSLNNLVGQEGPLIDPAPHLEEYTDVMEVVARGSDYRRYTCYSRSAYGAPGVDAKHRLADTGFRPVRTLDVETKGVGLRPNATPERTIQSAAVE